MIPDAAACSRLTEKVLPWLDARKLKLYAVYSVVRVDRSGAAADPLRKENLRLLRRRRTVVWLPTAGVGILRSDPTAERAVPAVREAADWAAGHGLAASIYPHAGHVIERVGDAVRLAEQTGRKHVGGAFNLRQWLRAEGTTSLEETLRRALRRLAMVTINGANRNGKEWIQPLDSGASTPRPCWAGCGSPGYRGPIGLQGYGAAARYGIEPLENLKRSMAAWRRPAARTAAP